MNTGERFQYLHDTRERFQRVFPDVNCADCGRRLVGDETIKHLWVVPWEREPPTCGGCVDRRRNE